MAGNEGTNPLNKDITTPFGAANFRFLRQYQLGQVQRVASPNIAILSASQSPRRDPPAVLLG